MNKSKDLNRKRCRDDSIKTPPGLIPAIIQDFNSGEVLMLAYMSKESLQKSIETKTTWFWSRSRDKLWNKGETSGNIQLIKEIKFDCDADTLLIKVEQVGVACHTGEKSCFFNEIPLKIPESKKKIKSLKMQDLEKSGCSGAAEPGFAVQSNLQILDELYQVINDRIINKSEGSYTYLLHKKGLDEILKKVGEESVEIILASKHQSRERIVSEISDLLYHLLVLMAEEKINLSDISKELKKRRK